MAALTLFKKDVLEHGLTALLLCAGLLLAVFITLDQNHTGAFSMSSLDIVRLSSLGILPLIAFIVGNRLIVREYLQRTRLFIEGLPLNKLTLVWVKYLTGLVYLVLLAALVVFIAADAARVTDDVDLRYLLLVMTRTLVFAWFVWSVVFSFSFCGFIRSGLYLAFVAIVFLLIGHPNIDQNQFGPFALLDAEVFAFERFDIPWRGIVETSVLSLLFTVLGFTLATVNEGSYAEALARPLNRRDYVAMSVLFFGGITLVAALAENWARVPYYFSSDTVVRNADPPVSVLYLAEQNRESAERLLDTLVDTVTAVQGELGVDKPPRVRVSLDTGLQKNQFGIDEVDGVLVRADFRDLDLFETAELQSVVLHELFQKLTNRRMAFEPNHWLLDGFSRWWAQQQVAASDGPEGALRQHHELIARAVFTRSIPLGELDLSLRWQVIADRAGYPAAASLAYSALAYLAESQGVPTLINLGAEFLTSPVSENSMASVRQALNPFDTRFKRIAGISFAEFQAGWLAWLDVQSRLPALEEKIALLPQFSTSIYANKVVDGARLFSVAIEMNKSPATSSDESCVILYRRVSPFDNEIDLDALRRKEVRCDTQPNDGQSSVHSVSSPYGAGDRLYVAVELVSAQFHLPLRLHSDRLNLP